MLKIGLTGGIGSGKSVVAKIFELLQVPVYYADEATKKLYHTDKELMVAMKQHFGTDIYVNERLNRALLAEKVFSDPDQLTLLNNLVHPLTIRDAKNWMARQKAAYIIKEAALLFESGSVADLDYVIGVSAPQALRMKRVMDRDGATREQVLDRMNKQIDSDLKIKLCDFEIRNNEQELVLPQVLKLHEHLIMLSTKG